MNKIRTYETFENNITKVIKSYNYDNNSFIVTIKEGKEYDFETQYDVEKITISTNGDVRILLTIGDNYLIVNETGDVKFMYNDVWDINYIDNDLYVTTYEHGKGNILYINGEEEKNIGPCVMFI